MIRLKTIWGIARAETRLTRRLVRYWVFASLATVVALVLYALYSFYHYFSSSISASAGITNPRYLIGAFGMWFMGVFLIGLIFLGFDIRARDTKDRIHEVLDSLPCTNLELVFGKFVGILIPTWIPLIVVMLLLTVGGTITGKYIEPMSQVFVTTLIAIPAYTFTLGLIFLLTLLVRHRGAAAVALLAVIIGLTVAIFFLPLWLSPLIDFNGLMLIGFPSDLLSGEIDAEIWFHRPGALLCGIGLLVLAAAIHPRRDDGSRLHRSGAGLAIFLAGFLLMGAAAWTRYQVVRNVRDWKAAHEARAGDLCPDLLSLTGTVEVDPGSRLAVRADLEIAAPADASLESALLTLNPGMQVKGITGSDGASLSFTHELGLLEVALSPAIPPGGATTLSMEIEGIPDAGFAYLDAVKVPLAMMAKDAQINALGDLSAIFSDRYVALLPGIRWLPAAGAEIGRAEPGVRAADFFDLDLTVKVPEGYTPAAPGARQEIEGDGDGWTVTRFAPPAPVPDAALIVGRFETLSAQIGDLRAELLLHPGHVESMEMFADAADLVRDWIAERLEEAEEIGLPYPYGAITMVEIPTRLRGYGGGWRLDSTMAPPAMLMVREWGLPTSDFRFLFDDPQRFEDREGGIRQAKVDHLVKFFEHDFTGGNPFVGLTRNLFRNQTAAGGGPEALPMDFVFEDLSRRLVVDRGAYYSAFLFDRDNTVMQQSMGRMFRSGPPGREVDITRLMMQSVANQTAVWNEILGVSLAEIDPWEDPRRTLDILTLKGGAMSRSMLDGLGREKAGRLLASMREDHLAGSYDREDIIAAGEEIEEDLETWLETWIDQTDLPGFQAPEAEAYRIRDAEDGSPRYQVRITVVNDEPVPGLLKIGYRIGRERRGRGEETEPFRIPASSAMEIGLVTSAAPRAVTVEPYLSLNRSMFTVRLPAVEESEVRNEDPFEGIRDSDWRPADAATIVVDDLDPGFSVEESGERGGFRLGGSAGNVEMDQGIPAHVIGRRPAEWSRMTLPSAFGKYRHTLALVRSGDGDTFAVFEAELPSAGAWALEYHVPTRRGGRRGRTGTVNLVVEGSAGSHEASLDTSGSESGWNLVDSWELEAGTVRVKISDESEGRMVAADAIRWVPSPANGKAEGGSS